MSKCAERNAASALGSLLKHVGEGGRDVGEHGVDVGQLVAREVAGRNVCETPAARTVTPRLTYRRSAVLRPVALGALDPPHSNLADDAPITAHIPRRFAMLRWQYAQRAFRSTLERTMEKGSLEAFSERRGGGHYHHYGA